MDDVAKIKKQFMMAHKAGDTKSAEIFLRKIRSLESAATTATADKPAGPAPVQVRQPSVIDSLGVGLKESGVGDVLAGAVRGAGSIGSNILRVGDVIDEKLAGGSDRGLTDLVTGKPSPTPHELRLAAMDKGLASMGADTGSTAFGAGKLGAEIAGTAGAGGAVGNMLLRAAPAAAPMAAALSSGGFRTGVTLPAGASVAARTGNALTRVAGGAGAGAASLGMIDPNQAGTGAVIGGALPGAAAAFGAAGKLVGRAAGSRAIAPEVLDVAKRARAEGLVIPPSEVNPTALNNILEGTTGRAYVAQNASNKNIEPIARIAARSVGAKDLSEASLSAVKQAANDAYAKVAAHGRFKSDATFRSEIDKAVSASDDMARDFPGVANKEAADLAESLKFNSDFGGQSTMEAIKRLRADAFANKSGQDAEKKALGAAQTKMAAALEDLVERNLVSSGNQALLTNFRGARDTLSQLHNLDKAINPATREVDAAKLAQVLKKGKKLTGDQKLLADFASTFPQAAQQGTKVRGLPSLSRLDFAAGLVGGYAAAPAAAAVLARPAVRELLLRSPVQNRLLADPAKQAAKRIRNEKIGNALTKTAVIGYGQ